MAMDQTTTTYKDIPGFPGYRIGDDGSVWSRWIACRQGRRFTDKWKRLKTTLCNHGYPRVNLTSPGGKHSTRRVHRIVLEVFIGAQPDEMECRHLNGDKTDNRLRNLAWGTRDENRGDNHALGAYRKGENHPNAKLTEDIVRAIRTRYAAGGVFQKTLAAEYGVSVTKIATIVSYQSWKHLS